MAYQEMPELETKIANAVSTVFCQLSKIRSTALRKCSIPPRDFLLLEAVVVGHLPTVKDLELLTARHGSNCYRQVKDLEARGWLKTSPDNARRGRPLKVRATSEGLNAFVEARTKLGSCVRAELRRHLGIEREEFNYALRQLLSASESD